MYSNIFKAKVDEFGHRLPLGPEQIKLLKEAVFDSREDLIITTINLYELIKNKPSLSILSMKKNIDYKIQKRNFELKLKKNHEKLVAAERAYKIFLNTYDRELWKNDFISCELCELEAKDDMRLEEEVDKLWDKLERFSGKKLLQYLSVETFKLRTFLEKKERQEKRRLQWIEHLPSDIRDQCRKILKGEG